MRSSPTVTDVHYRPARELDRQAGLLGWVRLTIDDLLILDGVTVRRTLRGELRLSFPERADASGQTHTLLRPVRAASWRSLEQQVFDALRREGFRL